MVRHRVMRFGHADFRIAARAGFAGQLERNDACDVAAERQQLQVKHQTSVISVLSRNPHRTIKIRQRIVFRRGFRFRNATFDLTDTVEVLVNTVRIFRADTRLHPLNFADNRVQQTGATL